MRIYDRDHDHEDSRTLHVYYLKLVPSIESLRKGIDEHGVLLGVARIYEYRWTYRKDSQSPIKD